MQTTQIKKELKKRFPGEDFRVRTDVTSKRVKTTLIKRIDRQRMEELEASFPLNDEEMKELEEIREQQERNRENVQAVKEALSELGAGENIHRDQATGEILTGGNSFVFVEEVEGRGY